MKDYKCPHCGTDLSIGMMILAPTNLYGEDYRYTTCRKCDNFLLVNLENFEFCKLPDDKETDFDAFENPVDDEEFEHFFGDGEEETAAETDAAETEESVKAAESNEEDDEEAEEQL